MRRLVQVLARYLCSARCKPHPFSEFNLDSVTKPNPRMVNATINWLGMLECAFLYYNLVPPWTMSPQCTGNNTDNRLSSITQKCTSSFSPK